MPRKKKLAICLICAWFTINLLSSCGFKDIDKRFFVVTIGIDQGKKNKDNYLVTLKLSIPTTQKEGKDEFVLASEEAHSITEAVRRIKSKVSKELDFGHAKMIVLGDSLVNKDIRDPMDWLIRRRDVQSVAWMGIGKPSALDVLKVKPKSERFPSQILILFFGRTGTESPSIISKYLFDFRRELTEKGIDAKLPVIQVRSGNQFTINRAAVFKNWRRAMTLQPKETKILNTFIEKTGKMDIKVTQPGEDFITAAEKVNSSFTISSAPAGKLVINVTVKIEGTIEEAHSKISWSKLPQYGKMTGSEIERQTRSLLLKLQKAHLDPIGFGLRYRSRNLASDKWESWQRLYPEAEFNVKANVKLENTGELK